MHGSRFFALSSLFLSVIIVVMLSCCPVSFPFYIIIRKPILIFLQFLDFQKFKILFLQPFNQPNL